MFHRCASVKFRHTESAVTACCISEPQFCAPITKFSHPRSPGLMQSLRQSTPPPEGADLVLCWACPSKEPISGRAMSLATATDAKEWRGPWIRTLGTSATLRIRRRSYWRFTRCAPALAPQITYGLPSCREMLARRARSAAGSPPCARPGRVGSSPRSAVSDVQGALFLSQPM
jgi:hypothetical protein